MAPPTAVLMVVYIAFAFEANNDSPPIMARKMQAMISPYSTAVAPETSRRNPVRESRPAS